MGSYVLTDGKGSYICRDGTKYVPIRSLAKAQQFDNLAKARAILNNAIPKRIRNGYAIQSIEIERDIIEKETITEQAEICCQSVEDDDIDEWLSKINEVIDFISKSDSRQSELSEKLAAIDKKIVDLEHYIEFGKFNAYQGWLCFKMLQTSLKQRRKYKNEMQAIKLIEQFGFENRAVKELSEKLTDIRNKRYRPRAIPELFK